MPVDGAGNSTGYVEVSVSPQRCSAKQGGSLAILRYPTSSEATVGNQTHDGTDLDRNHVMRAERLSTSEVFQSVQSTGGIDVQRLQGIVALQVV